LVEIVVRDKVPEPLGDVHQLKPRRLKIGKAGPVAARLTAQHVPDYALDDKIVSTLQGSIATNPVGPTVLAISMTHHDKDIIDGTLQAVVDQTRSKLATLSRRRALAQIDYFKSLTSSKQATWNEKLRELADYQTAHPTATAASDPQLQLDSSAAQVAYTDYSTVQAGLEGAQQSLKNVGSGVTYDQIDQPLAPVSLARKKKIVFGGVAGLFAGAIVSLLLLAGLANGDRTARRPDDIEDLEVVGNISEFPRSESDTTRSRRTRSS
jgi:hypothetical protein